MSDKELENKLRWIFETYGKDLQAFFRDAQREFNRVKFERQEDLTISEQYAKMIMSNEVLAQPNPVRTSKRKSF